MRTVALAGRGSRSEACTSGRLEWRILFCVVAGLLSATAAAGAERFEGQFFHGEGDTEYLQLLDTARRLFEPDPEWENLPMLYHPGWNGWVEGPTWGAWWIQNSYGPSYCGLPFWQEPYVTFLQNAQDLWFSQMGDGKRAGANNWVAPDGCLCDAAAPNWIYYKQGDGRIDIHDWGVEFTAAGLVLQAEALLVSRDAKALAYYLPKLERCAEFLESRRDPANNLFLAGAAGNLLAPSFAGAKRADGSYEKSYLAGLSITYLAGLDRLIELEKLAGATDRATLYANRRDLARKGLPLLTTEQGYFIKSLDADGTKHGLYGAKKHGYFEAVVNHDAICFRVADDAQAEQIYAKIAAIPELRRYDLVITNAPSLDDMYERPAGLWEYGRWVNGGHWSTCEARMIMAYYRLGKHEDARKSMKRILDFYRRFRADNPLVQFGGDVYQPNEPINCVYDTWGVPAAFIRGLFEYLYRADGLTILPHVPPRVVELQQRFPIRFGQKRLFLSTVGSGPVSGVTVNGQAWTGFDAKAVSLPYDRTPDEAYVQIQLGGASPKPLSPIKPDNELPAASIDVKTLRQDLFPIVSTNDLPMRIGASGDGGNRFVGDIGRARLYGRVLTADEVAAIAQNRAGALEKDPALIGDWKFDNRKEQSPQRALFPNSLGDHLPARILGEVSVVDGPHGGKAIHLEGKGYLEVAHDARLNLARGGTLEAWIRPGKLLEGGGRILDKCRVGTANGYTLDLFPGNSLRLIVEWGSPSAALGAPANQWVHVAATVGEDGALKLYANGQQIASQKTDLPPELASLESRVAKLRQFHQRLAAAGLGETYAAAHARLAVRYAAACTTRLKLVAEGKINRLPEPSQYAADRLFFATAAKLCDGLEKAILSYQKSDDPQKKQIYQFFK